MLLSYRDPQFWPKFRAEHWVPRVPTVLRQPFRDFPFSEAALHRALTSFEEKIRGGDLRSPCLVSVGDTETTPRRPLRELFRRRGETMAELEQNCNRVFSKKRFGLMVTHFQATDPGIWNPMTAFIQDARSCIDFPVPRAFLDLFYGNYLSNFTGVHKDTQEILAFVVRGEKRMLTWPFDYFLSRVEGLSAGDRYFHRRLDLDHRKFRKDAVVLEAKAGDVFYWPSDRWHVAETPHPGRFSAMVSLGLFRPEMVPSLGGVNRFREKLLLPNSAAPLSERSALRSQDMTDVVAAGEAARQLRWVTGFGFELGGPMADTAQKKWDRAVAVSKEPNCLLLWQQTKSPRRILVSANGHSLTLPHSVRVGEILERLSGGETVTVAPKPRRHGGKIAKVIETNWNKRVQLRARQRNSGDLALSLIDWLLRIHAVRRSSPPRAT